MASPHSSLPRLALGIQTQASVSRFCVQYAFCLFITKEWAPQTLSTPPRPYSTHDLILYLSAIWELHSSPDSPLLRGQRAPRGQSLGHTLGTASYSMCLVSCKPQCSLYNGTRRPALPPRLSQDLGAHTCAAAAQGLARNSHSSHYLLLLLLQKVRVEMLCVNYISLKKVRAGCI